MKDIVWGDVLSVRVTEIDNDHRMLINTFNVLNHAVAEGRSRDYLVAVLEELINCTVWHFSHEERLMLQYAYDDLAAHKAEHRELIGSARELQREILRGEEGVSEADIEYLERWLTEHIFTTDMRMGGFLYEAM